MVFNYEYQRALHEFFLSIWILPFLSLLINDYLACTYLHLCCNVVILKTLPQRKREKTAIIFVLYCTYVRKIWRDLGHRKGFLLYEDMHGCLITCEKVVPCVILHSIPWEDLLFSRALTDIHWTLYSAHIVGYKQNVIGIRKGIQWIRRYEKPLRWEFMLMYSPIRYFKTVNLLED